MIIDSTFLLVIFVFGFTLLIFGHVKKIRLFNLFSVFVWIFLATQLAEFLPLLLALIALSLYEVYYTFFGGLE